MDAVKAPLVQSAAELGLVSDTKSLNKLKNLAMGDPREQAHALKTAAAQFEALLVQQWFDAVRAGNDALNADSPLKSKYSGFFEDMLAQQQVTSVVEGRGGINKNSITYLIAKQFAGSLGDAGKELMAELDGMAVSGLRSDSAGSEVQLKGAGHRAAPAAALALSNARAAVNSFRAQYGQDGSLGEGPRHFSSPEDFVEKLMPFALKAVEQSGMNPLVLLSQAALETGWGEHVPENNNYFGIKAGASWQGPVQNLSSDEFRDGAFAPEVSAFRAYGGVEESMRDYVTLIQSNERYARAAQCSYDPDRYFEEIQKAGYATDPNYAAKLKSIARRIAFMAYK